LGSPSWSSASLEKADTDLLSDSRRASLAMNDDQMFRIVLMIGALILLPIMIY
jgi:hypothetical protein